MPSSAPTRVLRVGEPPHNVKLLDATSDNGFMFVPRRDTGTMISKQTHHVYKLYVYRKGGRDIFYGLPLPRRVRPARSDYGILRKPFTPPLYKTSRHVLL